MKTRFLTRSLPMIISLGIAFLSCKKDDDNGSSVPRLNSSANALFVKPFESETFTVNISATGMVNEVSATSTIGSISVDDVEGEGNATGKATLTFTAGAQEEEGSITITATDKSGLSSTISIAVNIEANPPITLTGGDVSGVWESGNTYIVRGDIVVPLNQSLTIEEGVTIIIDGDGSQGSPEIVVRGNIYSRGTEARPIIFTPPANLATQSNIFTGLWGGIICVGSVEEAVFEYTEILYAGAPAGQNSVTVAIGELDEGDERYGIYFENENGKFVLKNSRVSFTPDDGVVLNGGQVLVYNNLFEFNGRTGGECMNVNSGVEGDIAFNVFFHPATNGVKWDNKGNKSPQTDCRIYNNTVIGGGFRQEKSGRGGSFNVQRDGRGMVHNNLIVNCRFGVRLREDQLPDTANIVVGYNFHYGDVQSIVDEFYPSAGLLLQGASETNHDIIGAAGANNPQFVSYNVTNFNVQSAAQPNSVTLPSPTNNFRLQASSPALNVGKTNFSPKVGNLNTQVGTFNVPQPSNFCGAFGTE
ncbi:MAG: hypothetical protein EA358_03740 [Flavobacteriales bacterium]|nr:MAG: hypothetical protein EA358_03740 [Flavobacteriales bacterium]